LTALSPKISGVAKIILLCQAFGIQELRAAGNNSQQSSAGEKEVGGGAPCKLCLLIFTAVKTLISLSRFRAVEKRYFDSVRIVFI
jgi:hypothetical protein